MAAAFRKLVATLLFVELSLAEEIAEIRRDIGSVSLVNNLIEMDVELFEDLVAAKDETRVRHDQTWLIFFDSWACKRCPEVY